MFSADANGYLASATDPSSATTTFTYDPNGLLQSKTDALGGLSQYAYDTQGRLTHDQDAAGGAKALSESDTSTGSEVTLNTSMGVQTFLSTSLPPSGGMARTNTLPTGFQAQFQVTPGAVSTVIAPDSTKTVTTDAPDPRFGMLSPVHTVATTTPLGLLASTTISSRSMTLSGGALATWLEQTNVNGNSWQRLYTAATRTWTTTSPAGRTTTLVLDAAGRPSQVAVPNVTPFSYTYDVHGHLVAAAQGTRNWTESYDANGYLASTTDPLGHTVSYANDALGRPTTTTLADSRTLGQSYDGDDNATQIVLPSTEAHDFSFTPVNLLASYMPPSLGSSSPATAYSYDLDRRLTNVARPDGVSLSYSYDYTGRLQTLTMPLGTVYYGYDPNTGYLDSVIRPDGEFLSNSYDGFLKTRISWGGTVGGTVSFTFDNSFRVVSETAAGSAVSLTYDADGLLTQAGALTVARDPSNGRVTGTTLGSISDAYTYDANGLFASYGAQYSGTTVYSESVQRDAAGRITQKTESVQGTTHVWSYTYDVNGRLTEVSEDGGAPTQYGYDADDNRTSFTGPSGTVSPVYDAQDRLLTYGTASYAYTANGERTTKTDAAGTTSYTYDPLGNLLAAALPSGESITYAVDGENRRVGKSVGGTLSEGFLYKDSLSVVAQVDRSGNRVARYVFGSKPNVPDYFIDASGTSYRILSDHLGTPRLVANASTGAVVEEIDYDEFGNVVNDTQPGTTPFGFAGGLYDGDTGLVRFGARDYDASVGRRTRKDPLTFDGGSFNLYGYVLNDPVDRFDP